MSFSLRALAERSGRSIRAAILAVLLSLAPGALHAGPGHDHGPEPTATESRANPRVIANSEGYQFVGLLEGEVLVIYLDRALNNEPITNAEIEISVDGQAFKAELQADGTFEIVSPSLKSPGDKEILVTIREGSTTDLLIGALQVPGEAGSRDHHGLDAIFALGKTQILAMGIPLILGFLLGFAVRSRRNATAAILLIGIATLTGATNAKAGPGHDHGPETGSSSNGNAPARLPDGTVFLPKPTQRLLEVRTASAEPETVTRTVRLVGRIIPNPNRSGVVQSTISGRIIAPKAGLPRLGQAVKAGDVLAYVQPAFASIDASNMRQTLGELDSRIAIVNARLERLRKLATADIASKASLEEAELELTGLRKRREELLQSEVRPEPLVAPVDGVIADTALVSGQVVAPSDPLVRIVDPAGLWVEAFVFDQVNADAVQKAEAVTSDGRPLKLNFVGRSRALQQQATLVHFEIVTPPDNLNAGAPVTVIASRNETATGFVLPRAALAQSPNGQTVVFIHKDAELFVPKAVRFEKLDADRVLVVSGLSKGDKVVVQNAPLVNQVR